MQISGLSRFDASLSEFHGATRSDFSSQSRPMGLGEKLPKI
jgi:hypothetical protein